MLKMIEIQPRIEAALKGAGYTYVQQSAYGKRTNGRAQNVWISKQVVRAGVNTRGAEIVRGIAGVPNGSVGEAQQGNYDSWYTDGYRGRGTAAI